MSLRTLARLVTAVAVIAATVVLVPPASADQQDPFAGVVRVESGWLRGSVAADHVTYSAVPYAAAPVGELRWQPPHRPQRWRGTRDATGPSPLCPQGRPDELLGQEDCLFLDVSVPRDARRGDRLPVLVWVHGGGLDSGGARQFDGAQLAAAGDMIVVTVNYRLGALGFLATRGPDAIDGNYGLMDQAAALRWVRRNAARFGGDAGNVTLAGQSGGARSVCAHLASPTSRGLFDRAIIQSGACDNEVLTRAEAYEFGDRVIDDLGCADAGDVAACLRRSAPADLVGTLAGVGWDLTGRSGDRPWNPVAGTRFLPQQPAEALRTGSAARVPLLIGGTRDEMRGFVYGRQPDLSEERYREMTTEAFGADAGAVLAQYPATDYESPALALATVIGDWGGQIGACPVLRTAEAASTRQAVYAYEFAEDGGRTPDGFPLGAFHGLDLPYLWTLNGQTPYPPLNDEQERLSETMIDYWAAFVRSGDPNGPERATWPEFGRDGVVLGLSTAGIGATPAAEDHRCDFWATIED